MSTSTIKTLGEFMTDCARTTHRLSCYTPLPSHAAQQDFFNAKKTKKVYKSQFIRFRQFKRAKSLAVTDEEAGDLSGARLSISNSLTSVHKQCEQDDSEATNKLLEIGRVASWAVGFEKLLNDDAGLHVFTEFLKKEFSQENIQFWIACEKFKKLSDPEEIRHHANLIWSTYLHDTDDGSCPINIDSRTRQECQQSLLNKPHAHIFEKAQSQIFQLMKYDSYSRFLKSNMYKDCIMSEMEGKSIPFIKQQQQQQQQQTSSNYDERTKTLDSFAKLKDDEKKDKKRSPLLPWTKAFIKWKRLSATPETIKRDTPSSLSNLHHQTANANIYHWFFTHINDKILQFDYSPLDNIEGDLDLSQILNNDIEHENLNINHFEDFMELNLDEVRQNEVTMSSSATIWLITVGWSDASLVDFLVRSSCSLTTKLDIYHWFFTHINDKILQFDYSPLDNIEGDLDLSQILNNDIEHENLNINHFEDFMELNLDEIELFMCENGRAHGMVVTVDKAKQQNYQIINLDNDPTSIVWKVTYNPRFLNCISHKNLPNLYDLQRTTRSNYLWQIHTKQEHEVYQYIFKNLNLFHIDTLPDLMNKTQDDLIKLVELPLEQTDYQIISEMISLQCCHRNDQHEHHHSEQQVFVILVEPALNLLDIIDI
ncbi:unnamed protein product [Rotaria sordida]|uniref:RGS domain-containing protein n=1 Tax=Rotaria sordida TaxID=392033 RepID=A0A814K8C2_9BILA|nr:unnamed protein product [Rotaria sordida]